MSMSVPMRKDEPEKDLTTADLAHSKAPVAVRSETRESQKLAERSSDASVRSATVSGSSREVDSSVNDIHNAVATPNANSDVRRAADTTPLFPNEELEDLRKRWSDVQAAFVDEPRRAVEQADSLVASAMKRLAEVFTEERSTLEQQWDRGDSVSTEDLRIALQRYRTFFQRLLSI
jgi:hypothetical protein